MDRKYFFIIFALFYILISSFSNCFAMNFLGSDEENGDPQISKHHQLINEKDERIDLSTPLIPVPEDSPQATLNQLFTGIKKGNKTLFPYDTELDSIITSWMTYTVPLYSFREEDEGPTLWKGIIFFEEFDKIFFHQPVSYKTRFLELLWAGFFALAPFGMGPSVPYLAENILGFLPVGGIVAEGIIMTAIVLIVAPCAEQGRQVGRKIGNFFFDKNGFTETQPDGKPHLTSNSLPMAIISKILPAGGAVLRASPFLIIFWEAERKFDTLRKVFIGSYAASLLERAYDYGSEFWARFTQNQQSEETKIQRQILRNALGKIRKLINADGSDELVRTLMQHIRNELPRIKLFCDLEPLLKRKLASDQDLNALQTPQEHLIPIVSILFEYIQKEFPAVTSDTAMEKSLRDDLKDMLLSVNLDDKKAVYYIYYNTLKSLKIVKLKYELNKNPKEIKEILASCIRKELEGKILDVEEQEQIERFLKEKEQIFLQGNNMPINDEKRLEVKEKEQIFIQNDDTNEEKIQNILSATDKLISHYKGRETENNLVLTCVMSILFVNNKDALDIERLKRDLITAAFETTESPAFSRKPPKIELKSLASVRLRQVVDSIKEIPLEKMRALIQNIKSLPPVSSAKEFLKNVANLSQGMSTPGRWFITLWTIQAIGKFFGDEGEFPFVMGCSLATFDVLYRITQEWYLQQDIVSNFRYFGSMANDSWPIRWITNGLSAITSTFYTLPAVSILFDLLGQKADLYVKIVLSAFTSPSEYFSFLGFFKEKWDSIITNIAKTPLPCAPEWKKRMEDRAQLNDYLNRLDTLMGQLDRFSVTQTSTVMEKKTTAAAVYQ